MLRAVLWLLLELLIMRLQNDGELLWDKVVRVKVEEKPTKSGGVFSKHYWSRE